MTGRVKKGLRILQLALDRHPPARIVEIMAGHPAGPPSLGSVRTVISKARKDGLFIPEPDPVTGGGVGVKLHEVRVRADLLGRLKRAARRREITADVLAGRLPETIAADRMVDAVLDDRHSPEGVRRRWSEKANPASVRSDRGFHPVASIA